MTMRWLIRDWFEWMGASLSVNKPDDFVISDTESEL